MKRLIVIVLALLVFTGCAQEQPVETTVATTPVVTEPLSFYEPDSSIELQTGGAVRAYPLENRQYHAVLPMGENLLLVSNDGQVDMLRGEKAELVTTVHTDVDLLDHVAFSVSDSGISYYRSDENQVVLLDARLMEYAQIELPADISGEPAVSFATGEVYYCIGQELRALEMESGVSRLVLSHRYRMAELVGCHLDGTVLMLKTENQDGKQAYFYVDAATGQIFYETKEELTFYSYKNSYLLERIDGGVRQYVFGTVQTQPQCLDTEKEVYGTLRQNAAVGCDTDSGFAQLDLYDLSSGLRTAGVTVPSVSQILDVDSDGRYIWVLGCSEDGYTLYRWDPVQTPVVDEQVYTKPVHTSQQPDEAGLENCRQQAQAMEDHYGIEIGIWEDAVRTSGNFELTPEHQPAVISEMLSELETALAQFPERFLAKMIYGGKLQINLVRSIEEGKTCDRYYADGNVYIVLTPDSDMSTDLLQAIAYISDTTVLGNSRDYDDWAQLNPKGFDYAYTYDWTPDEEEAVYLEEGSRYFIDELAMTYPHEDRARIFVYAMRADGETYFTEDAMQRKLQRLCEGIREAYGLEKLEESMPWEQFLTREMNYSNK